MTKRIKLGQEPRAHTGEVTAPLPAGATPFRWEWIDESHHERVYAETADELLEEWIPGYLALDEDDRLRARLEHAAAVRAEVAADLVAQAEIDGALIGADERAVLLGSSWTPPAVEVWSHEVPLVLIDAFYRPFTGRAVPISGIDGDVEQPRNVVWLRPSSPSEYLRSLAAAGVLTLAERPA